MNRRAVACLSAFLIIFQMVVVPFASAMAQGVHGDNCVHAGAVHAWHPDDGCDDGRATDHHGPTQHPARTGLQCHCVHSVAQTTIAGQLLRLEAVQPRSECIEARHSGPAFPAPLFDFFRPPD